jgi:protein-L-isoaspartate O-methyltransferase
MHQVRPQAAGLQMEEVIATITALVRGIAAEAASLVKSLIQYRERKRVERVARDLLPVSRLSLAESPVGRPDREDLERQIADLNPWFYKLEVLGVRVRPGVYPSRQQRDMGTRALVNRQMCRTSLLVGEVARRFDFSGARLLDVACNCGYWSSVYITRYGADSVVGIEGRDLFVNQANLYYSSLGIQDRALFVRDNVMDCDYEKWGEGAFDFVLCAGILYHIKEHEELLRRLAHVNRSVLVIDTRVSEEGHESIEPGTLYFNAIEQTRANKVPRKADLIDIVVGLGYDVETLQPTFKSIDGVAGSDDYNAGRRICLFCRRRR